MADFCQKLLLQKHVLSHAVSVHLKRTLLPLNTREHLGLDNMITIYPSVSLVNFHLQYCQTWRKIAKRLILKWFGETNVVAIAIPKSPHKCANHHQKSGAAGPPKSPLWRKIATTGNPAFYLLLHTSFEPDPIAKKVHVV